MILLKKQARRGNSRSFIFLFWSVIKTPLSLQFKGNDAEAHHGETDRHHEGSGVIKNNPSIVAGMLVDFLKSSTNGWQRKAAQRGLLIPSPTLIKQNLETLV